MSPEDNTESLRLKWGTLKAWELRTEESYAAFERYVAEGVSGSAALQHDTPAQKQAICDLIDAINGPITNDWSGETMTKDEAKKYVMEYGQ
ncbi:MAG: hypothetical protein ACK4RV_10460 [Caulobacter sp.]